MKQIILASQSPRRKKLLETIFGDNFKIHISDYKEINNLDSKPIEIAKKHAIGKARDVAKNYKNAIIIGADVFVFFNKEILGKPKDEQDAFLMLKKILGKWVDVISGLAVIDVQSNKEYVDYELTKVKMAKLTDKEIWAYIKTNDPMDKAGSFGMQDKGAILVEKIDGCYSNVVGLPLPKLHKVLKKLKIDIFNY